MMARTHVLTASLLTLAAGDLLRVNGHPGRPTSLLIAAAIAGGAALLPDLDHHSALATHALGPVSALSSRLLRPLFGPHRHGTHSICFAVLAAVATYGVTRLPGLVWHGLRLRPTAIIVAGCVYLAIRGLGLPLLRLPGGSLALALAVSAMAPVAGANAWLLSLLIGGGCLAHDVADALNEEGVPLLWPLHRPGRALWRARLALVGPTDHWRERCVFAPAMGAGTLALAILLLCGWPR